MESYLNLFNLIISDVSLPINEALNASGLLDSIILFINNLLNNLINFRKENFTFVEYIDNKLISDILAVVFLIFVINCVIKLIVSFFKLVSNEDKREKWRSNWKRKKKGKE